MHMLKDDLIDFVFKIVKFIRVEGVRGKGRLKKILVNLIKMI